MLSESERLATLFEMLKVPIWCSRIVPEMLAVFKSPSRIVGYARRLDIARTELHEDLNLEIRSARDQMSSTAVPTVDSKQTYGTYLLSDIVTLRRLVGKNLKKRAVLTPKLQKDFEELEACLSIIDSELRMKPAVKDGMTKSVREPYPHDLYMLDPGVRKNFASHTCDLCRPLGLHNACEILPAYAVLARNRREVNQLYVWCRYCWMMHIHDGGNDPLAGSGDGPRIPHCVYDDAIGKYDAYVLKCVGLLSEVVKKSHHSSRQTRGRYLKYLQALKG